MRLTESEYLALVNRKDAKPSRKQRPRKAKPGGVGQLVCKEPGRIVLLLPIRIESEANCRDGWRAKANRVRLQREEVRIEWQRLVGKVEIGLPCCVTFTRYGAKHLDDDGLIIGFKACRDEIASILGTDDNPDAPVTWKYRQAPDGVRVYRVEVEVRWEVQR